MIDVLQGETAPYRLCCALLFVDRPIPVYCMSSTEDRFVITSATLSSPLKLELWRFSDYEVRRAKVKLVPLHDLQPSLPHDPHDVPVPVAPPLGGVRRGVLVEHVGQPRVRTRDRPCSISSSLPPLSPSPPHPRHLSQRRDRVLVAAQPKRVHHGVEAPGLETHALLRLHVLPPSVQSPTTNRSLGPAHLHHRRRAVRRRELRAFGVVPEVSSSPARGADGRGGARVSEGLTWRGGPPGSGRRGEKDRREGLCCPGGAHPAATSRTFPRAWRIIHHRMSLIPVKNCATRAPRRTSARDRRTLFVAAPPPPSNPLSCRCSRTKPSTSRASSTLARAVRALAGHGPEHGSVPDGRTHGRRRGAAEGARGVENRSHTHRASRCDDESSQQNASQSADFSAGSLRIRPAPAHPRGAAR